MSLRSLTHNASIAAAVIGTVLAVSPAPAADLDFPTGYGYGDAPPPETKVQFGTGWYVRGDIGATRLPNMNLTDPTVTGQTPTVTLNNGSKLGYTASLGAGYSFNQWFRSDIIVDIHQPYSVKQFGQNFPAGANNASGTCQVGYTSSGSDANGDPIYQPYYENCSSQYQASVSSYDVLVNGYIDLGHWWRVTPYVGGGIGMSFGHYSASTAFYNPDGTSYNTYFTLPETGTVVHGYNDARLSGNYYNFAFAATAGIAIDVFAHTKLDINYRYVHLGQVLGANITSQEVRAGLRYMIDN